MLNVISWFGGKTRQLKNLFPIFAQINRKCYVEPFGGAGCVLLNKPVEKYEVYNDINGLLCNLFRQLRDPKTEEVFLYLQSIFPMGREFFCEMRKICWAYFYKDFEKCARLIVDAKLDSYSMEMAVAFAFFYCHNTCFGGSFLRSYGGGATESSLATTYKNRIDKLGKLKERLHAVQIESLDAIECIKKYDAPTTLFYVDPPYDGHSSDDYKTGWTTEKTRELLDTCIGSSGSCVISCYDSDEYTRLLDCGFEKRQFSSYKSLAQLKREGATETVYFRINPAMKIGDATLALESYHP